MSEVRARAEQQAAKVKTEYKARQGHDVSKYKVEFESTERAVRKTDPAVALDPL